jgi:hypothetical protein
LPPPRAAGLTALGTGTFFSGFSFYRLFCCLVVLAVPATIVAILLTR